jgi:hypothetical protein
MPELVPFGCQWGWKEGALEGVVEGTRYKVDDDQVVQFGSTAGVRLGNVSLGTGSIGQPRSEIFPRLRQFIILHKPLGYYPPLFLPCPSLGVYEVPFHQATATHPFLHHIVGAAWQPVAYRVSGSLGYRTVVEPTMTMDHGRNWTTNLCRHVSRGSSSLERLL